MTPQNLIKIGLDILKIEGVFVHIKPLTLQHKKKARRRGFRLRACISGANGQYILHMEPMNDYDLIKVLAHELIHLQQLEQKELQIVGDSAWYRGNLYHNVSNLTYEERPWERAAEDQSRWLEAEIRRII